MYFDTSDPNSFSRRRNVRVFQSLAPLFVRFLRAMVGINDTRVWRFAIGKIGEEARRRQSYLKANVALFNTMKHPPEISVSVACKR